MSRKFTSALSVMLASLALAVQPTVYADAAIQQATRVKIDGQELYAVGFDKLAGFE